MKKLRNRTTLYAFLFLTAAVCLMVAVMLRRNYAVADDSTRLFETSSAPVEGDASVNESPTADASSNPSHGISLIESDAIDAPTVFIPLPDYIHFEDITFENHYLEHTLAIHIQTDSPSFLEDLEITARAGLLSDAAYMYDEDAQLLTIAIVANSLMEFFPVCTNAAGNVADASYSTDADFRGDNNSVASTDYRNSNAVVVTCQSPTALYDNIIVIDPIYSSAQASDTIAAYGSTDTAAHPNGANRHDDAALRLAKEMQAQAATLDNSTRIYITRTDKTPLEKELILNLINESGAVKYLALMLPSGDVSPRASAYFNDLFYIRDYGNLQLAADAEQALTAVTDMTLTGVYAAGASLDQTEPAGADAWSVLDTLKIPGALLRIDGLSSNDDRDSERISQAAAALLEIF